MMAPFRSACEALLRIPPDPEPPPGDETTARTFRAAPSYFHLLLARWFGKNLFLLVGVAFALILPVLAALSEGKRRGSEETLVLLLALLFLALFMVAAQALFHLAVLRLDFEKRWYVVTDRSLRVREGVVVVREMTISFANIQDVAVTQGPLERMLGIANVRVTTAGGGGGAGAGHGARTPTSYSLHQAWFRGIANAEEIRDLVIARQRALKDSGLGDPDDLATPAAMDLDAPVLDALRAVLEEARALRQAAQQAEP